MALFFTGQTMSQRPSGYARKLNEDYPTPQWVLVALLSQLQVPIRRAWDPCAGSGHLVAALKAQGVGVVGTTGDFLLTTSPPPDVSDLITNPPYGEARRGELAVCFIEHALNLMVPRIAMLLRNDFDSAFGRQHLFRRCPYFSGKIVLLNRIRWFEGPSAPSDNHSWFTWNRAQLGPPTIRYAARVETEAA
jgi:hypothetical protein